MKNLVTLKGSLSDAANNIAEILQNQSRANGKTNDFDGIEVVEDSEGNYVAVVNETVWSEDLNEEGELDAETFEHRFVISSENGFDLNADLTLSY